MSHAPYEELLRVRVRSLASRSRLLHSTSSWGDGQPVRSANGYEIAFTVQWHLTDACNLSCLHCYQSDEATELSLAEKYATIDRLVGFFRRMRVKGIIMLTGGEPFMDPHLEAVVARIEEYAQQGLPLRVGFMTNGTCFGAQHLRLLRRIKPWLEGIQVSLEGCSAETHDLIRGKGTLDMALAAIERFRAEGIPTAVHMVLSKLNAAEAVPLLSLAAKMAVGRVTISRLVPLGRGTELAAQVLTPSELKEVWSVLTPVAEELVEKVCRGEGRTVLARARCDLWHLVDPDYSLATWKFPGLPPYLRVGQECPVGQTGLVINADGSILPCRRLPLVLGNIINDDPLRVWFDSDVLWRMRRRDRFQTGKCRECRFMTDTGMSFLCRGGAPCLSLAVNGDMFTPDPQCWYDPESSPVRGA